MELLGEGCVGKGVDVAGVQGAKDWQREREKLRKYQKMQMEGCVPQPAWELEMCIRE